VRRAAALPARSSVLSIGKGLRVQDFRDGGTVPAHPRHADVWRWRIDLKAFKGHLPKQIACFPA
jgi:hypothetical protein